MLNINSPFLFNGDSERMRVQMQTQYILNWKSEMDTCSPNSVSVIIVTKRTREKGELEMSEAAMSRKSREYGNRNTQEHFPSKQKEYLSSFVPGQKVFYFTVNTD